MVAVTPRAYALLCWKVKYGTNCIIFVERTGRLRPADMDEDAFPSQRHLTGRAGALGDPDLSGPAYSCSGLTSLGRMGDSDGRVAARSANPPAATRNRSGPVRSHHSRPGLARRRDLPLGAALPGLRDRARANRPAE